MKILGRSEILNLTNKTLEAFKSELRREQVPLFAGESVKVPDDRRGYLPIEAVMMVLADEAARDGAMDRTIAARLIVGHNNLVIDALEKVESEPQAIWMVFGREFGLANHTVSEVGTFGEIVSELRAFDAADNVHGEPLKIASLTWLNVSEAVRLVRARAEEFGIDLPKAWVD